MWQIVYFLVIRFQDHNYHFISTYTSYVLFHTFKAFSCLGLESIRNIYSGILQVEQKKWKLYCNVLDFLRMCIYRTSNALVWFLFKFSPQFIILPLHNKRSCSKITVVENHRYVVYPLTKYSAILLHIYVQ